MTISKSDFLETARKSRVVTDQQLQAWADNPETDGVRIANQMVREKVLTEWQAKYLLTGRHQLDIGPYRLLERTQRDELGDRFSAIHLQLGRNVDLQMLSSALSKDQVQYQAFIERVGQTSKLDHPNLIHVYDVDKAGGRYYLVTEHVDGERFSDLKGNILDLASLAKWLNQAISGLRLVHAQGLVHGDLRLEDLMIDREHGVKIQNLAITDLRMPWEAKQNGPRTALDDWRSLGKIFQDFNKQVAASHSSADQSEWLTLIHELANSRDIGKIDEIEQRLTVVRTNLGTVASAEALGVRLDQIDDLSLEEHAETEFVTTTPSSRNRVQATSGSNTESKSSLAASKMTRGSDQDESEDDANLDDSFFAKLAVGNPVGLLSSAFVVGLMLAGTLTYLILGAQADRSVAQANGNFKSEMPMQKKLVPTSLKQGNQEANGSGLGSLDQIDPEVFINRLEQAEPDPEPPAPADANPDISPVAQATLPPPAQAMVAEAPASTPIVETQTVQLPADQPVSVPSVEPAASEPVPVQSTPAQPVPAGTLTPEEMQKRMESPFAQMSKQLSLPLTEDTVEVKLGEVFVSDRFLLGAELVVNPAISTQKVHFEAMRDATNNQRWLIHVSRTPKDKKSPIAVLRRDAQDVFFQWLPEAKNKRQAVRLKNCMLKLFVPDKSVLLPLRSPVEITPLVLEAEKLAVESTFELDFLPKPENLLVEVLPVAIDDTRLQPSVIDLNGIPGRVLLKREDDKATVWVNLELELKAKSKVRASLVASDGVRLKPLKNLKELQALAVNWKQQELFLTQQISVAEATPAPYGKADEKKTFIEELNRQQKQASSYATKFQQYVELAPKMMGQPYGIRIVARYDGVEVELARTKVSSPE